jgi:hypothetical protein
MRFAMSALLMVGILSAVPLLAGCDHDDHDHDREHTTVIHEQPARYEEHHDDDHGRVEERTTVHEYRD